MGKADLHIHTRVSDGLATIEQLLEYVEHGTDLDVIAVTDHEDATGGLRAREQAAKRGLRFEVIVGAEITTLHGHLLGLFLEETPKSFRSAERTLEAIHRQGGLAIAPHPMSWLTRSLSERTIDRITERSEAGVVFDGIEIGNPSPAGRVTAAKAERMNRARWRIAETGGSDAHHLGHVGSGWTDFAGTTANELRGAIGDCSSVGRRVQYAPAREIGFGKIALGLVWGYAATPRKMLRFGSGRAQE